MSASPSPFPQPLFSRRRALTLGVSAAAGLLRPAPCLAAPDRLPPLPRWRGFNLLEMFNGSAKPFRESDFAWIAELGFDFVRLPVDYRSYIAGNDWTRFAEEKLRHFDQALEWGGRHGVHVCLNLHRAPGWTVARPAEELSLWTDPEARRVAALHWGMFARRFKGVPSRRLSFNLFNEPAGVETADYVAVVGEMMEAIRGEDPQRLVFCDGLGWGRRPVPELLPLRVAMMNRGYSPMELTHYRADWVQMDAPWRPPAWPACSGASGALLGPPHREKSRPLTLTGPFPDGCELTLAAGVVSTRAVLSVRAGGRQLLQREFTAGPGEGPWKTSRWIEQYRLYRCTYDERIPIPIPNGARSVELSVPDGDWLRLFGLEMTCPGGGTLVVDLPDAWGADPGELRFSPAAEGRPATLGRMRDRTWLEEESAAWLDFEKAGGRVMVGEWGCFQHTPPEAALAWAADNLAVWKARGWGWALWNFRGPFGILDNDRKGAETRDFHGHRLDVKLLELLQNG